MPQIIPIKDLRDTIKVSEMCNSLNEPIFITKNGYGDMVIMSMKAYEEQLAKIEIYNKVMQAKTSVDEGRFTDGPTAMAKIKEKFVK